MKVLSLTTPLKTRFKPKKDCIHVSVTLPSRWMALLPQKHRSTNDLHLSPPTQQPPPHAPSPTSSQCPTTVSSSAPSSSYIPQDHSLALLGTPHTHLQPPKPRALQSNSCRNSQLGKNTIERRAPPTREREHNPLVPLRPAHALGRRSRRRSSSNSWAVAKQRRLFIRHRHRQRGMRRAHDDGLLLLFLIPGRTRSCSLFEV